MAWRNYTGPSSPAYGSGPATAVSTVTQVMGTLQGQVTTFTNQALAVLSQLQSLQVPITEAAPTLVVPARVPLPAWPAPQMLAPGQLGSVEVALPQNPTDPYVNTNILVDIPTWTPSIVRLNIPASPAAIDTSGLPTRPAVDMNVAIPTSPSLVMPVMDSLDGVTIPQFAAPTLPLFDGTLPEFAEAAPNLQLGWVEPAYASESLDVVQETIQRMMAGGTGLAPEIEQQLFDRARAREDMTAHKATAEAFDTFANKGFAMPPGALVAQVNAAAEQGRLAANALQREVMTKVADIEVENMRFAVGQAVAVEQLLVNIFNNAAQRSFEIARFVVESQIQLYNAKISLYNTLAGAYASRAQVFKIKVDAALAQLDVYRLQLDGQKLVGEINLQRVQTFNARVQALLAQVEIYKADMQGAQLKTEVIRSQLDAYRTDVQAYAERVGADKLRFDAYRTQMDGEVAKVGVLEAEARVFGERVRAADVQASIGFKGVDAQLQKMSADTQRFVALVDRSKTDLSARLGAFEANARLAGLNISYLTAQNEATRSKNEADVRVAEVQLQTNALISNTAIERYRVNITRVLEEAKLKENALAAAGQIASTLAGGAMAAQHVQASISASSSDSSSTSTSFQQSGNENWNYQGRG